MNWNFWKKQADNRALEERDEVAKECDKLRQEKYDLNYKVSTLEKERNQLKEQVEDLKLKKKISEEDIQHLVKIKLEQADIDKQKHIAKADAEKSAAIFAVKSEYQQKVEHNLLEQQKQLRDMYSEVLARLPNVNVMLGDQKKDE